MLSVSLHNGWDDVGLGLYIPPTDFTCLAVPANFICYPSRTGVRDAYKELQKTVKTIAAQMAASGRIAIPGDLTTMKIDGDIGMISSIGVQMIGAAFTAVAIPPADVAYTLESAISAEETVRRIAARAIEIDAWFKFVAGNYPDALNPQPAVVKEIEEKIIEKIVYLRPVRKFTPVGALVLAAGIVTVMGLTASAIVAARRNTSTPRRDY
jgi:hypothetical protein